MSALNLNNISSPAPSPTPLTSLQTYFKDRAPDVRKLSDALKAGDLNAAKQAYNNLVSLGNSAIDRNNPFFRSDRAADFNAIGTALLSGDLAGAQQAFAALHSTFGHPPAQPTPLGSGVPDSNVKLTGTTTPTQGGLNVIA
ncbi:MAG TPA: hypothetical protein VNZ03_33885 [Terriglobales bacterium]|jgi:hypothetical protein|nr:hypothetical protein [Terriglobales bacterium]